MRAWETHQLAHVHKMRDNWVEDGDTLVNKRTMDATATIQGVRMMEELQRPYRNEHGMLHIGSIDPITAINWARECGAAVGTKEFAKYAKKKLLSGEFSHFRSKRNKRFV